MLSKLFDKISTINKIKVIHTSPQLQNRPESRTKSNYSKSIFLYFYLVVPSYFNNRKNKKKKQQLQQNYMKT